MAKLKSIFVAGAMDSEKDPSFVEKGFTRESQNLRFNSNGGNDGVAVNIKGTREISDFTSGRYDMKCIGAYHNQDKDTIYYMIGDNEGVISKICEYNINTRESVIICEDNQSILSLRNDGYITGIDEIDGLLYWVQWGNNPRRINVERAKKYGRNGYTENDIMVMVKPPLDKLKITLQKSESQEENYIEEKFLSFSYQYRYLDGEYSSLAPFTNFAFRAKPFNYSFSEQSNKSMVNDFNQILIEFNTGNKRVTEIRLVFKESESNTEWIVDDFNKKKLGYGDDTIEQFLFDNSKVYRALSDNIIRNYFNNVPKEVKSQAMINGRLLYGNYTEGYNLIDEENNPIELKYKLNLIATDNKELNPNSYTQSYSRSLRHIPNSSTGELILRNNGSFDWNTTLDEMSITSVYNRGDYYILDSNPRELKLKKKNQPYPTYAGDTITTFEWTQDKYRKANKALPTAKSIRDYEVGMIYAEEHGRSSIVLVSKTNTINIPIENSVTQNQIQVELTHNPPKFATNYRFFIKPNRKGYDQILPTLFYEDGVYRWVKIEGADKDKIREGDYLIVKTDSQESLTRLVKTKILEISQKEKNFLQGLNDTDEIKEKSGLYFKIQPKNFRLNTIDFETYRLWTRSRRNKNKRIEGQTAYIDQPHFYGETLDDLSSSGTYTGNQDERNRYIIEIDGVGTGTGGVDTFRWSDDDGVTIRASRVPITGADQALNKGVAIKFGSTTGHSRTDNWAINARAVFSSPAVNNYGFFRVIDETGSPITELEERIPSGARIELVYNQYGVNKFFNIENTTNESYDNLQEWFIKERIYNEILSQVPDFNPENFHFVKGILKKDRFDNVYLEQDLINGVTTLIVKSIGKRDAYGYTGAETNYVASGNQNIIIFETEGEESPAESYFEIGKTYRIEDGKHKADLSLFPKDQNQTETDPLKVTLDWFNAFSYGNGVESYKIKDEFNRKGLDTGIRTLTTIKDEYKEITRIADITWSDVYEEELSFNGLSTFNQSLINFVKIDKENGSIQKMLNANGNLMVFQEDSIGLMPYNKNVIYDTQGQKTVGVSTDVLNEQSYQAYAEGKYGTKNPESIVAVGNRKYGVDQARGIVFRLSNNGMTPLNEYNYNKKFTELMRYNENKFIVGGYDPQHDEYIFPLFTENKDYRDALDLRKNRKTLSFSEKAKGFPTYYTFDPDFILHADNEMYLWKNGVMYLANASDTRNNFFNQQYTSKIKFFVNEEFSIEKIWKAIGIESTHSWYADLKTKLTARKISKLLFKEIEDYWYSDIMGNTNNNLKANSIFGMGSFAIVNGVIQTSTKYASIAVGDLIVASDNSIPPTEIKTITETNIVLLDPINSSIKFLMYKKNQNVDGSSIRGNTLEVELESDVVDKVELRAVNFEVVKSENS